MRVERILTVFAVLLALVAVGYAQFEPVQGQVLSSDRTLEIVSSPALAIPTTSTNLVPTAQPVAVSLPATSRQVVAPTVSATELSAPLTTTTSSSTTSTSTPSTTTTTSTIPSITTTEAPPLGPNESLIATARDDTPFLVAYDSPEGNIVPLPFAVPNPHQFGGPLTLRVTEGALTDDWVKVALPVRPNGQEAWIPTESYTMSTTTIHAEVNLTTTSVRVFDDDVLIAETQAAIGSPSTPTPLGTFYVVAARENPASHSFLGTHALVLSGFSEALDTFSGGLPVIAIHGTNSPDDQLGHAISNGCLRVPNSVSEFLAQNVPLGAPVTISG